MFVRTLYVWVLLGLPFGFWLLRRREHRRDAAIRNLSIAIEQSHAAVRGGELALKVALERAESGDRAKDRFLATMSHEMRTPLNGISGFTSLLGETKLTPEQAEYVESIRRSSNALIQLTENILELARLESGKLKPEPAFCDPCQCVEDILDILAVQAAAKGVELLHWVESDVPATILIDEIRLRQVLLNLVGNAVKFTEAGEVEVTVQAERAPNFAACGQWLLSFAIRDTGIGIAPQHLERLFKPFSQVDESSTRRYGAPAWAWRSRTTSSG